MRNRTIVDPRFGNPTSATQLLAKQLMESGMGKVSNVGEGINSAVGSLAGAYLQNQASDTNSQNQNNYYKELSTLQMLNKEAGGNNEDLVNAMASSNNPFVQQDAQGLKSQMFAEALKPQKPESVGAGASLVDPKTGNVIFSSPDSASRGGATGAIIDRIMTDPEFAKAAQNYQTGWRQGIIPDGNGGVVQQPGYAEAKGGIKYAETTGGNQSDLQYKPQITTANKIAERRGEAQGNLNYDTAALPQLEATVAQLSDLGKKATYTIAGRIRDRTVREAGLGATDGAVAREAYANTVRNQVLPLLRQTFGAQFTKAEGDKLEETLGDINKTPQEKDAALQAFIQQKKAAIGTNQRMVGQQPGAPVDYKSKYGLQ